jgi:hypothetical protein
MTPWKPDDVSLQLEHVATCQCAYRPVVPGSTEDVKMIDARCIAAYLTPTKAKLIEPADLKMTREALCAAQSALYRVANGMDVDRLPHWVERINSLIRGIDERRPLGPDGKHDDRHTPHCGCED